VWTGAFLSHTLVWSLGRLARFVKNKKEQIQEAKDVEEKENYELTLKI